MFRDKIIAVVVFYLLIAVRITGFVAVSPFPGAYAPRHAKVGLVMTLSFFATAMAEDPVAPLTLDLGLGRLVVSEVALGLLMGFIVRIAFAAAETAGDVTSHALGLSSASLFDPSTGAQETVISRVFALLGTLVFLASGAHRAVLGYVVDSFVALPVGTTTHVTASLPVVLDLFLEATSAGLRLAMPMLGVSLAVQAVLAFTARIAPSLQIFNVGFAILIAAGLLTLAATLPDLTTLLSEFTLRIPRGIERVLDATAE
ncbi:MAG: flagellar biosynthetic protein FliR [Polyangiaceae bacterium]